MVKIPTRGSHEQLENLAPGYSREQRILSAESAVSRGFISAAKLSIPLHIVEY